MSKKSASKLVSEPRPNKDEFLRELKKKTPGWSLCPVVHPVTQAKMFALSPTIGYPIYGDDMLIYQPIVPIGNNNDAFYGYFREVNTADLPNDPHQLEDILEQTLATYNFVKDQPKYTDCPACKNKRGESTGLTKQGHLCRHCFGLRHIYPFGPQQKFGKKLLRRFNIRFYDETWKFHSNQSGFKYPIELYRIYQFDFPSGIVREIFVDYCGKILQIHFSDVVIYKTEDDIKETSGWSSFIPNTDGQNRYRHYYVLHRGKYLNLLSGKVEVLSQTPQSASIPQDLPQGNCKHLKVDLLYHLSCLYAR